MLRGSEGLQVANSVALLTVLLLIAVALVTILHRGVRRPRGRIVQPDRHEGSPTSRVRRTHKASGTLDSVACQLDHLGAGACGPEMRDSAAGTAGITVVIASSGRPRTGFEMLQLLNNVPVYRRHHPKQA